MRITNLPVPRQIIHPIQEVYDTCWVVLEQTYHELETELLTTSHSYFHDLFYLPLPCIIDIYARLMVQTIFSLPSSSSNTWCSYRCYEIRWSSGSQPRTASVFVCTALSWGYSLLPLALIERLKVKISNSAKNVKFSKKNKRLTSQDSSATSDTTPPAGTGERRMEASLKLPNLVRSTAGAVPILNEKGKFINRCVSLTWTWDLWHP